MAFTKLHRLWQNASERDLHFDFSLTVTIEGPREKPSDSNPRIVLSKLCLMMIPVFTHRASLSSRGNALAAPWETKCSLLFLRFRTGSTHYRFQNSGLRTGFAGSYRFHIYTINEGMAA